MLRFLLALLLGAGIAGIAGFSGLVHPWGGLARSLFFLYAGLFAICAIFALLTRTV